MGFWSGASFIFRDQSQLLEMTQDSGETFAVDATSIDPAVFGLTSYSDPIAPAPRVSRREAIQVPAVKRARDLIASVLGELPFAVKDTEHVVHENDLLNQPERGRTASVTMTRTVEDLFFEGEAWWRITERAFDGYPRFVQRIDPRRVDVDEHTGVVRVDGQQVDPQSLIQFESPNDPVLIAGARAIRTCLKLDAAAAMYADEPMPTGYFSPAEGADPTDDEDVATLLNAWNSARKTNATAYVSAALKYNATQFNAEQIQLADQRQHAVLEIARLTGVDPEELGVSTTSRTYANQFDRRKAFLDFTLGPYLTAVEQRLSMGDITKRGYLVRFNLSAFLRSDDKTRMETYVLAEQVGAISKDEIRDLEDKPALAVQPATAREASRRQPSPPSRSPRLACASTQQQPARQFSVDTEKRTITGLAVPYGKSAKSGGKSWQFSRGVISSRTSRESSCSQATTGGRPSATPSHWTRPTMASLPPSRSSAEPKATRHLPTPVKACGTACPVGSPTASPTTTATASSTPRSHPSPKSHSPRARHTTTHASPQSPHPATSPGSTT